MNGIPAPCFETEMEMYRPGRHRRGMTYGYVNETFKEGNKSNAQDKDKNGWGQSLPFLVDDHCHCGTGQFARICVVNLLRDNVSLEVLYLTKSTMWLNTDLLRLHPDAIRPNREGADWLHFPSNFPPYFPWIFLFFFHGFFHGISTGNCLLCTENIFCISASK